MKKQILFLTMFTLALIFAGMNSFGQTTLNVEEPNLDAGATTPDCTPALPLACADDTDPLSPVPGVTYTYEIEVLASSNAIHWLVTDDADIWLAGALVATADADGGAGTYILDAEDAAYNIDPLGAGAVNQSTIDISWKSFDGVANEVLLVAYAVDGAGCTDNIEVWRIQPQYNFTLDIAALEDNGTLQDPTNSGECVSPFVSAQYDGTNLNMDYGENYIFYSVNAANWQTSWQPTFSIDPTGTATTNSNVVGVEWAYPDEATDPSAWHTAADQIEASHYTTEQINGFVGSNGACIILKVQVDHTDPAIPVQNELIAAETVVIGIDGEMWNAEAGSGAGGYDGTYLDMDDNAGTCVTDVTDEAGYIITPRPDVNEVNPAPTSFVVKQ